MKSLLIIPDEAIKRLRSLEHLVSQAPLRNANPGVLCKANISSCPLREVLGEVAFIRRPLMYTHMESLISTCSNLNPMRPTL